MTPDEIKKAIRKNTTQIAIAQEEGVSGMSISRVVNKKDISDRLMTAVAKAIGKDKTEVFPEYYYGPKHRRTSKVLDS